MSTWVKLHDNFWRNPKILAAGEDAGCLYIQGLCYCSDSETDGRIPISALRMLTARKDAKTLARILVREGLWTETAGGWQVHDYLKVQRSKAQIEAEREKNRLRKARSRSSHGGTDGGSHADVTPPDTEAVTETDNPPKSPQLERIVDLVFDKTLADKQRRGEQIASVKGYRAWWDDNEAEGARKRAAWVLETFDMPSDSHYADATRAPATPQWARSMMRLVPQENP